MDIDSTSLAKRGLRFLWEIDDPALSYEFDTTIFLADEDGVIWYSMDSGCSCPVPFEYIEFPADFRRFSDATQATEAERAVLDYYASPHMTSVVRDAFVHLRKWLQEKPSSDANEEAA